METTFSLDPAQQRGVFEALSGLATRHIADSGGRLELLELDTETMAAQAGYHISGDPFPARKIDTIAGIAEPRFPALLEAASSKAASPAIEETADTLSAGGNIMMVTNHGEITDIAIAEAALYSTLKKKEIEFASAIIISKMVSVLGFKIVSDQPPVPATTVLTWLCNDIYLSFPRTPSIHQSVIGRNMEGMVSSHNVQMINAVSKRLGKGGVMLAMAPSGSTDKRVQGTRDMYGLEPLNRGTARLMQQEGTKVLPVAIWLKDEQPFFEIVDKPRTITTNDAAHEVMHDLADTLGRNIENRRFTYLRDKARKLHKRY